MTQLHTDPALLATLKLAASQPLSPGEARQQRVSYVMASLSKRNDMTREQVEGVIDEKEGRPFHR